MHSTTELQQTSLEGVERPPNKNMKAHCHYERCSKEYVRSVPFQKFCCKNCKDSYHYHANPKKKNRSWRRNAKQLATQKVYLMGYRERNRHDLREASRARYWLMIKGLDYIPPRSKA